MQLHTEFVNQVRRTFASEADDMLTAIADSAPEVSIRINPAKVAADRLAGLRPVPWCKWGAYLDERPQFTFDVDFQAGNYYVQDASSMFIAHVIAQCVKTPVRYLDLCAAPGGKTTAAISALPAGSLVVANEIVPARAKILAQNVEKWGAGNCFVSSNAPADLGKLTHYFDVVAADVPCSGEGMFRKDDEAVAQWTPQLVAECAARQRDIVADAWQALRPGGLFVYSTCTYNTLEDEDMVAYMVSELGAVPQEVDVTGCTGVHVAVKGEWPCYRFLPHMVRGEGLFVCVMRKPDDEPVKDVMRRRKKNLGNRPKGVAAPETVKSWLRSGGDCTIAAHGDRIVACQAQFGEDLVLLSKNLRLLHDGTLVGVQKGRNIVPSQQLAWSADLAREAFVVAEVDYATAIAFLQRQTVVVDAPKGYVLLAHRGAPLGFVNNLGTRANNLYPKEYRILSQHVPEQEPQVLR